jgi:hypothetical protein
MIDGWLNRPRGTEPARPDMRAQGARAQDHGVIIRSSHAPIWRISLALS